MAAAKARWVGRRPSAECFHRLVAAPDRRARPPDARARVGRGCRRRASDRSARRGARNAPRLDDLLAFAARDDIDPLCQAAVVHAQFESIHPFTDGNGRIGRALIGAVLRRRGIANRVVVPLASAMVARREQYFDDLGAYRAGDAGPLVTSVARASVVAADESRCSARRLALMPQEWRERAGRPRAGSAAARLVDTLLDHPVFSAEDAERRVGGATSSVYTASERLRETGVIRPLTRRTRNQVWIVAALSDELDDLGVRIAVRARAGPR